MIDQPNNTPEPEDQLQLPTLYEAVLDDAFVDALLRDIEQCAVLIEVTGKGGPERRAEALDKDLPAARRWLAQGVGRGIQMHYLFEGQQWLDTLLRLDRGVKVVRMLQPG